MLEKNATCTVCGLRPCKLPAGLDLVKLMTAMDNEIRKSIFQGFTIFQTGMAMGADIWAAEIILTLKREFPNIRLVCYLPCETQANRWKNVWREKYFSILAEADDVLCLQAHYSRGCVQRRNRKMIDNSSHLIAVYNGTSNDETKQTIRYARTRAIGIAIVDPGDCLPTC